MVVAALLVMPPFSPVRPTSSNPTTRSLSDSKSLRTTWQPISLTISHASKADSFEKKTGITRVTKSQDRRLFSSRDAAETLARILSDHRLTGIPKNEQELHYFCQLCRFPGMPNAPVPTYKPAVKRSQI